MYMRFAGKETLPRAILFKVGRGQAKVGVVYTMDHEVIPRSCKICNWLLNSFQDHFGLHQEKIIRVTMSLEVPKRHILKPTLFTNMVQRVLQ